MPPGGAYERARGAPSLGPANWASGTVAVVAKGSAVVGVSLRPRAKPPATYGLLLNTAQSETSPMDGTASLVSAELRHHSATNPDARDATMPPRVARGASSSGPPSMEPSDASGPGWDGASFPTLPESSTWPGLHYGEGHH